MRERLIRILRGLCTNEGTTSLLDCLVRELRVKGVVGGAAREVGELVEVLLLLPDVPVEALGERGEPVGDLVLRAYRRHRVDGRGHAEAVEEKY